MAEGKALVFRTLVIKTYQTENFFTSLYQQLRKINAIAFSKNSVREWNPSGDVFVNSLHIIILIQQSLSLVTARYIAYACG